MGRLLIISAMSLLTQEPAGTLPNYFEDKFTIFRMALLKAVRLDKKSGNRTSHMMEMGATRLGLL